MTHPLHIAPQGERALVITRRFDAPPHLVFGAHTVPALIRRWMTGPDGWSMDVCEVDLRPGGAFRYVWKHRDGREMGMGGVFREIDPPARIVHAESFDEDWTGGEVIVTSSFAAEGTGTLLTLTCLYSSAEARDGAAGSNMETGMEVSYALLDALLAEPAA